MQIDGIDVNTFDIRYVISVPNLCVKVEKCPFSSYQNIVNCKT